MVDISTGRVMGGGTPAGIASREAEAKAYNPECRTRKASEKEINAMLKGMGITPKPLGKRKHVGLTRWKKRDTEDYRSMDEVIAQDMKRVEELETQMKEEADEKTAEPKAAPKPPTKSATKPQAKTEPIYPQDEEEDEFRYFDCEWLDDVARGLTAGATKHPGETWRTIPAKEHVARIMRHCVKYLMGDTSEDHLTHISMRAMMAYRTDKIERQAAEDNKKLP